MIFVCQQLFLFFYNFFEIVCDASEILFCCDFDIAVITGCKMYFFLCKLFYNHRIISYIFSCSVFLEIIICLFNQAYIKYLRCLYKPYIIPVGSYYGIAFIIGYSYCVFASYRKHSCPVKLYIIIEPVKKFFRNTWSCSVMYENIILHRRL